MQKTVRSVPVDGKARMGGGRQPRSVATTTRKARIAVLDLVVWGALAAGLMALAAALVLH